jgi:hypothetical protein
MLRWAILDFEPVTSSVSAILARMMMRRQPRVRELEPQDVGLRVVLPQRWRWLPCVVAVQGIFAGDLGERGGIDYRPQSSSPSSATISRLWRRSAIGVTLAGSVGSICQWRRAMLTGDKPRAASSCLTSLSKLARDPRSSASANIRARRACVRVQPGAQAALCGVCHSELQISSSSADASLSGHSGAEPCLPSAGRRITGGPLRERRRARGSCSGPGMSQF